MTPDELRSLADEADAAMSRADYDFPFHYKGPSLADLARLCAEMADALENALASVRQLTGKNEP